MTPDAENIYEGIQDGMNKTIGDFLVLASVSCTFTLAFSNRRRSRRRQWRRGGIWSSGRCPRRRRT